MEKLDWDIPGGPFDVTGMTKLDKLKHHTSLFLSMEKGGKALSYPGS